MLLLAARYRTTVTLVVTIVDAKVAILGASQESSMPEAELHQTFLSKTPWLFRKAISASLNSGEVEPHPLKIKDVAMYIYTSGTTS